MKKLLAMVLALVMTLSLAVSASAFKDDKDVSADYAEAVAVLNGMDVFKGYEDGSFKPQGNITRAEVATIIYRIYTGDVAKNDKSGLYSTYNKFSDMTGAGWAAGYIGYCANAELVKGYPDGTFKPSGNVTGYEVLAMILRAVGYDKNNEFSGADWSLNVAKYAEQLGVLKNVDKNTNLGAPATRELVAEILFRAIQQPTETVTTETRYRTETRTDSEGNTYTVRVPYTWTICTVTLKNFDLSHVPVYMMGEEQLSLYATYMSTLGNRPDLFPSSGYVNKYIENPPTAWEIPAEYLTDERFNTLITEAEKYLGYPYVWGGSSPSTSFDCSGFVSYVLTNSGLCNTGRLGAQGLYNISTPVSDPQPGDLVFFVGTYDTSGVSHVGIYVGDGMMLHCGDPIQYSNLNTSYWQSHFYAYGRPPYN